MNYNHILSVTEARKKIFDITEKVQSPGRYFVLTEKGKAQAVIMSAEEFESWAETLQVLGELPRLKSMVQEARRDSLAGKVVSLSDIRTKYSVPSTTHKKSRKKSR
jgi:prevent-host-death family protein